MLRKRAGIKEIGKEDLFTRQERDTCDITQGRKYYYDSMKYQHTSTVVALFRT